MLFKRTGINAMYIGAIFFLIFSLGRADAIFWEMGWISKGMLFVKNVVFFPLYFCDIKKGSPLDTGLFYVPAGIVILAFWGFLLTLFQRRK